MAKRNEESDSEPAAHRHLRGPLVLCHDDGSPTLRTMHLAEGEAHRAIRLLDGRGLGTIVEDKAAKGV